MKDFEDKKYEAWREQVEANLLIYLKKNLLTKPSASSATTHRSVADEGTGSDDASASLTAALQSQGNLQGHTVDLVSINHHVTKFLPTRKDCSPGMAILNL